MSHAPVSTECLNCHATLAGPYCAACGQKASTPNPTFHDLMHEFLHETLHIDGRIWRSVWLLLARPGRITVEYCAGHKARFLTPLRLYLIFSIIAVATSTLPGSHSDEERRPARPVTTEQGAVSPARQVAEVADEENDVIRTGNLPVRKQLAGKLSTQEVRERVSHAWHDWLPRMNLFLIPIWAWLAMLVTRKARRADTHNFPEYLYFALHANAAFSASFIVDNLIDVVPWRHADTLGDFISVMYCAGYTVIGLRTVYRGGWTRNVLRALAIAILYGIIYVTAVGLLITAALMM
jgi:hypothetical protein